MNLLHNIYASIRHPEGLWGEILVKKMNGPKHEALSKWVFEDYHIKEDAVIVDLGCGGGANIARMLEMCPKGTVTGLDNSNVSMKISQEVNHKAIADKRCAIVGGNMKQLPLPKEHYDLATAFETVYFWPSIEECFTEVYRVLKPGGTFLIANERDGQGPNDAKWADRIGDTVFYSAEELKQHMANSGFKNIKMRHDEESHFICVIGRK